LSDLPQRTELESHQPPRDRVSGGQGFQRFVGQVEQLRMRIVLVGQLAEQLGDIVSGV
jgi:CHASE2 domain-containing sensor protein